LSNVRISVRHGAAPPVKATPEGLPDVSEGLAVLNSAKLLWQGAHGRIALHGGGTPHARNGRPGILAQLNVSGIIADTWDGYQPGPFHSPSNYARSAMYRFLRDAGNMICVERRKGDGSTWWIADDWHDAPVPVPAAERKITAAEAGEDRPEHPVEVKYACRVPGCADGKPMRPAGMGLHLRTHGLSYTDYKAMVAGEKPWPGDEPASTDVYESTGLRGDPVARRGGSLRGQITGDVMSPAVWADPADAVEALVAEVRQLRATVSNDDLVEENKYLREQLEKTRADNTRLRQRLEAADRVLGRR
jgi:hypothetical protein